jgi:hypothetical protein
MIRCTGRAGVVCDGPTVILREGFGASESGGSSSFWGPSGGGWTSSSSSSSSFAELDIVTDSWLKLRSKPEISGPSSTTRPCSIATWPITGVS